MLDIALDGIRQLIQRQKDSLNLTQEEINVLGKA